MTKDERQAEILSHLTTTTFSSISDLLSILNTSESTLKRDLIELSNKGKIRRMRGGAMIIDDTRIDVDYLTKLTPYVNDGMKTEVAQRAMPYIKTNDMIFMDSSSTVLHMIPLMKDIHDITIVTNSVLTAMLLSEYTDNEVILLGGVVSHKKFTINDSRSIAQLMNYQFDSAFISARAYTNTELGENTENEAVLKHQLRDRCSTIYVLVTPNKQDISYRYTSLRCNDYVLV